MRVIIQEIRYMKSILKFASLIIAVFCLSAHLQAQQPGKYRLSFTDKNNSPYSISNPLAFLSQRAIDRRTMHGIPVSTQDLPLNPSYVSGVQALGATVINKSKWFNSMIITIGNAAQYSQINALPYVSSLEYAAPLSIPISGPESGKFGMPDAIPFANPGEEMYLRSRQQGRSVSVIDYGLAANQAEMISVDLLHDAGYQGQGMIIAVIDAGFTAVDVLPVFDSLWMNGQILGAVDFAEPGSNIFSTHSHGTMVLSIMGGNIPMQMVGTAPKASYWLLRSEIGSSEYRVEEDNWVAAAEFADSAGVDIINSSLGYTEFDDSTQNYIYENMDGNTTRVTQGADIAASKGMIVVNSAGNSGTSSWGYISAPSDGDSVIAVGAVDFFGTYAPFSSRGPSYDGRVKPDVSAQGSGTTIADIWGNITSGSGTSFSSPVIAGATACLWQAAVGMSNMAVVNAIKQSAHIFAFPDSLYGYGIPNYSAAALILGNPVKRNKYQQVVVYPNPFYSTLSFSIPEHAAEVDIILYDITGKELWKESQKIWNGNARIQYRGLENLAPGLYVIQLKGEGFVHSARIVKAAKP